MRNLKKFLALVLAMLMVVSAAATVSAFEDVAEENDFYAAITKLNELGIVTGMTTEEFGIDTNVQRIHAAIMFARALTAKVDSNDYWNTGIPMFSDVTEYQYAVTVAQQAGIIDGVANPDGTITFNPKDNITYIQALKMAVCALGLGDGLTWGVDGTAYYLVADDYGLTDGVNYITDPAQALTRGEFAQIIYNMIYAEYYDADLDKVTTMAKKIFDDPKDPEIVIPDTYTTFIITSTNKQAAYENMEITEGDIVGMQKLENGVPVGDTVYVETSKLGLAEGADVEDYFLHAFDFVNLNENGEYDRIEPTAGASSWVILASEISAVNPTYNRFTYGGKNYYMVDAKTGDAYKNEVVVYSTLDLGSNETKELYMNKNDQVLHPTSNEPVLEKVVSARGNVRYRVLVEDKNADIKAGDYITEAEAIALYGVEIENVELPYSIMDAGNLGSNYALVVFNDGDDDKMDRAYWTPVYMTKVPSAMKDGESPINKDSKFADETYAAGTIIVYTYNDQLDEINVLKASTSGEGVVESINTRYKNVDTSTTEDYYSTITLEDGTVLKLYNNDRVTAATIGNKFGAKNTTAFADDDALLKSLEKGSPLKYTVLDNVICSASTYDIDEDYDRVVLKEVVDTDFDAIYLDVYNEKGEVEELAINVLNVGGKMVDLADLSWIRLSSILSDLAEEENIGNIYRVAGDRMSISMDYSGKLTEDKADDADKFGLLKVNLAGIEELVIEDNVASDVDFVRENRLRTNEDTVWYFIDDAANTVKKFSGELDYATIAINAGVKDKLDTYIYADKIGFSGTNRGVASIVYVINAGDTFGFGGEATVESIVYLGGVDANEDIDDYYDKGSAGKFNLDTKKYIAKNYYEYENTLVVDMYTGKNVTIYSDFELATETFYTVDENNVVVAPYAYLAEDANGNKWVDLDGELGENGEHEGGLLTTIQINVEDLVLDDEYRYIDGILDESWEIEKFVVVKADTAKRTEIDDDLDVWTKLTTIGSTFNTNFTNNTGLSKTDVNAFVLVNPALNDANRNVPNYDAEAGKYYDEDAVYVIIVGGEYDDSQNEFFSVTLDADVEETVTVDIYVGDRVIADDVVLEAGDKYNLKRAYNGEITVEIVNATNDKAADDYDIDYSNEGMTAIITYVGNIDVDGTAWTAAESGQFSSNCNYSRHAGKATTTLDRAKTTATTKVTLYEVNNDNKDIVKVPLNTPIHQINVGDDYLVLRGVKFDGVMVDGSNGWDEVDCTKFDVTDWAVDDSGELTVSVTRIDDNYSFAAGTYTIYLGVYSEAYIVAYTFIVA